MKWKIKGLLIILFLIIISVAIFVFPSHENLTEKAVKNKDISYCEKIDDQGYKNQCYFKLSEFIPEACDKIDPFYCRGSPCFSDSPLIGQCYLNLYEKTKDENYCVKMESQGGDYEYIKTCFTESGYYGDSLCKKFVSSYHNFWDCYVNRLKIRPNVTEEVCKQFTQISEDAKTRCYGDLARNTKNEKYCDLCTYRSFTKYYCIIDVAKAKNDTKICDKLPSNCYHCKGGDACPHPGWSDCQSFIDYCKYEVNPSEHISIEYCEQSYEKYNCFNKLAVLSGDVSICENYIPEDAGNDLNSWRDVCYNYYAKNKLDETICEKISDTKSQKRYRCYYDVAIEKNDSAICEEILRFNQPYIYEQCKQKASVRS